MKTIAYHVTLEHYDGPLDLLLSLVIKAQVDIRDIFISSITDQFLEYMRSLDSAMDRAGEFLEMAARLLQIKSRRLLPNAEADEELRDMSEELIAQLEEYRRYKWVSEELRQREEEGKAFFYRLPQEHPPGELVLENASVQQLYRAFLMLMAHAGEAGEEHEEERSIERDSFTVQQQLITIRHAIRTRGSVRFSELFSAHPTRAEVVAAFMALLEMIKLQEISLVQDELFSEITISLRHTEDGDDDTDTKGA